MLQIFHGKPSINSLPTDKKQKLIERMMNDLDNVGIFNDMPLYGEPYDNDDNNSDNIAKSFKVDHLTFVTTDKRIDNHQDRLKKDGFTTNKICRDSEKTKSKKEANKQVDIKPKNVQTFRYGRTPLHEAIVSRDMKTVLLYINNGQFKEDKDNNNATAYELALYENYTAAVIILQHNGYDKKCEK